MTDWKTKAIAASRGTQTGAILCCALDEHTPAPCYHGKASLTSDGFLIADFTGRDGHRHMGAFVGAASDLKDNAIKLADFLKLDDDDRRELFAVFKDWIGSDSSGKGIGL